MDVLTAIEAAHAPLTKEELMEFCGPMYSDDRLDSLCRSGDVAELSGAKGVYWAVPPHLKKRKPLGHTQSPMRTLDRATLIQHINSMRGKMQTLQKEIDALVLRKDEFPTQEERKAHIQRLHMYNEIKDDGQKVLGKLAELKGTTVEALYPDYSLDLAD